MYTDLWAIDQDEETGTITLNNPRAPQFKKFMLAIGWLDPQGEGLAGQHCVLLGGIQTDDRLLILDEHSGDMSELISGTIDLKDMFFATQLHVDTTDTDLMMPIYEADGLTRYISLGNSPVGRPIWQSPDQNWPHFRSRGLVTMVHNVPQSLRLSQHSGVSRLVQLTKSGRLLVHSRCPGVQLVMDAIRPSDVANHPVFKALTYLVNSYQHNNTQFDSGPTDHFASAKVYKNLKKR